MTEFASSQSGQPRQPRIAIPTSPRDGGPLRIMLVDDAVLFREGLASLLLAAGIQVVAQRSDGTGVVDAAHEHQPDIAIVDIAMPPTHTSEGIEVALALRALTPRVPALVLSAHCEGALARQLFADGSDGLGYLLKDRVSDVRTLLTAIDAVLHGESVVDPEVFAQLSALQPVRSVLDALTERERDVLRLMTQGMSNVGIGQAIFLSPRTVEAHIARIFDKLELSTDERVNNRRVLAVLTYLNEQGRGAH